MKLKSLLIAASIATLATPALADNWNYTPGLLVAPTAYAIPVFHLQNASFTDLIEFSVAQVVNVSFGMNQIPNVITYGAPPISITVWDISNLNAQLYTGLTGGSLVNATTVLDGGSASWILGAGNYHFKVMGDADGTRGGTYLSSLSVTAVPEPESYAMLLAGLGLMAFIGRRRSNSQA